MWPFNGKIYSRQYNPSISRFVSLNHYQIPHCSGCILGVVAPLNLFMSVHFRSTAFLGGRSSSTPFNVSQIRVTAFLWGWSSSKPSNVCPISVTAFLGGWSSSKPFNVCPISVTAFLGGWSSSTPCFVRRLYIKSYFGIKVLVICESRNHMIVYLSVCRQYIRSFPQLHVSILHYV